MAVHRIEIKLPPKQLLYKDTSFIVYADGAALGELKISQGTIDWRPAGYQKSVMWSWELFAKAMTNKDAIRKVLK